MKKIHYGFLVLPLLLGALCGCAQQSEPENFNTQAIDTPQHSGPLGEFGLLTPGDGIVVSEVVNFTWEESSNCDYYAIEIANTINFTYDDTDPEIIYVREPNLSFAKYDLTYSLPKKDVFYYWRVTSFNKDSSKLCRETKKFFYASSKGFEIPIQIEDEQDWAIHKEGSQPELSINRNDFFGNGKNSLVIKFDIEKTYQGIPSSDGWMVITKTQESDLYGTDAFYFNFYYTGQDASVLVRVLDYDGEYWHNEVRIANNCKQTILMKYSDFSLRTTGSNIYNKKFDWEHIHYFEIVFEKTYGDGVCIFSDIKAVEFKNYEYMFIDHVDFKMSDQSKWTYENYQMGVTITSEDDKKNNVIELSYNSTGGYAYQNVDIYKYLSPGDALRFKVKYTAIGGSANFYFRVLEEDGDRWQFKIPFSYFTAGEYKELIIPLKSFLRTDYMSGDGARQLTFIKKFNIGYNDNYTAGSMFIKDIEVISQHDPKDVDDHKIIKTMKRVVGSDGLIEDYDNYDIYTQIYRQWQQSTGNKDEAMKLDVNHKIGGFANNSCAEYDYKADMEQAVYQLYLDTTNVENKNAFSIWLKDSSFKDEQSIYNYLKEDDVVAKLTIQLTLDSGEWYRYTIDKVARDWNKYTIPFSAFKLANKDDLFDDPKPLVVNKILHMAFGFEYTYYGPDHKTKVPCYAIANPVYLDEIYFTNTGSKVVLVEEIPGSMSQDTNGITKIDDIEGYETEEEVFDQWSYGNSYSYCLFERCDSEVSSKGGKYSMKMHYMGDGDKSVSYIRSTLFKRNIKAKGILIDIKGDDKANIFINLFWRRGQKAPLKMRAKIENLSSTWKTYTVGFDNFIEVSGTRHDLAQNDARNVEQISFGFSNSDYSESDVYIDNIRFSANVAYTDFESHPID